MDFPINLKPFMPLIDKFITQENFNGIINEILSNYRIDENEKENIVVIAPDESGNATIAVMSLDFDDKISNIKSSLPIVDFVKLLIEKGTEKKKK